MLCSLDKLGKNAHVKEDLPCYTLGIDKQARTNFFIIKNTNKAL
jgi:hypothetical protein